MLVVLPVSRLINVNLTEHEFVPNSTSFMEISTWELNGGFNPKGETSMITLEGRFPSPTAHVPRAEGVFNGDLNLLFAVTEP